MARLSTSTGGRTDAPRPRSSSAVVDALSHRRRRRVLAVLSDGGSASESELAAALARTDDADERRRVAVSLHHRHLPKLADAELVVRDADSRTVSPTDHPLFGTRAFDAVVRDPDASPDELDAALSALADPRRRTALAVLLTAGRPLAEAEVAERVAVRDGARGAGVLVGLMTDLHHVHLPALDRAGLVAHDAEARRASADGSPALDAAWFADAFPHPRTGGDGARARDGHAR